MRQEIEHKAQLRKVQALYTKATYYLVSNYKAMSHQTRVRISQPMNHQSSVCNSINVAARRSNQK